MHIQKNEPPRSFQAGRTVPIQLKDCAHISLEPDEQVTFVTPSGGEYDVVRKSWGFYATPSLNWRLANFRLRSALVRNPDGRFYLLLVEHGKEVDFDQYIQREKYQIVLWLDNDQDLQTLLKRLADGK